MSEGKRPGGLTALAVLNFIFGGFGLVMAAITAIANAVSVEDAEAQQAIKQAMEEAGPLFLIGLILGAISTVLLITSGIGYLQQKRFLGRTLGSTYAALSIAFSLIRSAMLSPEIGGGFSIVTIIGLIYPVLTLVLLNGTFKHDLVR
jgi:hypothetical protein